MKNNVRLAVRFFLWGVLVIVGVGAALFAYFVYTPAPAIPPLTGTFTKDSIVVNGLTRTYRMYTPRGFARGSPLVVLLHGSGENGVQMRLETGYGFDRLADAHGFAVAYPNAHDGLWETCSIVGANSTGARAIDDVAFLTRMVDTIVGATGVDATHVFAVGSSRGGSMAIRLALEAPLRFRAVAAVSASVPTPDNFRCTPAARTASVMIMNGTDDPLVPFEGGQVSLFGLLYKNGTVRSSRASGQYFADLNGITAAPHITERQLADGIRVEEVRWGSEPGVNVELVAIHGAGHGMPQPYRRRPRLLGPSPKEPNGPEMIWAFFER